MSNESTTAARPLPAYRSHKTVWALKIASAEAIVRSSDGAVTGYVLHFATPGYAPIEVTSAWARRTDSPLEGGYWVQYAGGYTSWSPAEAFEDGHTPTHQWGLPRSQEPKYSVNERGRLYNLVTGVAIPDEEPVMVFRAKDTIALEALRAYRAALIGGDVDPAHLQLVETRIRDFEAFAVGFPHRMRAPNSPLAIA